MIQGNVIGFQAQIGVVFCLPQQSEILEILRDYHLGIDFCDGRTVVIDEIL
jgi:hypothetical protein